MYVRDISHRLWSHRPSPMCALLYKRVVIIKYMPSALLSAVSSLVRNVQLLCILLCWTSLHVCIKMISSAMLKKRTSIAVAV